MRYRVYKYGDDAQYAGEIFVMEFWSYDFRVEFADPKATEGQRRIVAIPYSREYVDKVCIYPITDIQLGLSVFIIKDDHGRIVWDGERKMP